MEDAFWDGVLEGLNRDPPDYKRIVGLLEEVKLELESLVPDAWKQELHECMDVEIFAQVCTWCVCIILNKVSLFLFHFLIHCPNPLGS
jgi:hypothetical protein